MPRKTLWDGIKEAAETGNPNVPLTGTKRAPQAMRAQEKAAVDVLELINRCENKPPEIDVEIPKASCDGCPRTQQADMLELTTDGRAYCDGCLHRWRLTGME